MDWEELQNYRPLYSLDRPSEELQENDVWAAWVALQNYRPPDCPPEFIPESDKAEKLQKINKAVVASAYLQQLAVLSKK
jgi:hypothetical protein